MRENHEKCIKIILHHEGGYVDHPDDPGGETNLGVTKKVWEEWGGTKDMKDLTVDDVVPVYKKNYWDRVKGDDLPSGMDLAVFDWAVNSGTGRAAKKLQAMTGTTVGPNTLRILDEYIDEHGMETTIKNYTDIRQSFYESLKTFETFGKGWTRRNKETCETAIGMI